MRRNQQNPVWKSVFQKSVIILFWLCVWQAVAILVHNNILLVGPLEVGKAFFQNLARPDFLQIVMSSFAKIGFGFLAACAAGLLLGTLSYRYALSEAMLSPLITTLKSIPVASFVVLLLIWFGSERLSFFISFLIVFPNLYVNTMAGLKSTDRQLLEMADVFGMPGWKRIFYLYRPALMPYFISSLKISLGMSWKSGVAAEVIGMPKYSLGERLYMSKIYLDTAGLFAWTLLVILLSFLFEKAVLYLAEKFAGWQPLPCGIVSGKEDGCKCEKTNYGADGKSKIQAIRLSNLRKAYGEEPVLDNFSLTLHPGGHYCLMAPSGGGKTTLLALINRTQQADGGTMEGVPKTVGMVFQENRLCESYDVITNIMLTTKTGGKFMKASGTAMRANAADKADSIEIEKRSRKEIKKKIRHEMEKEVMRILPEDCLTKPVNTLSGGMKRRCAIVRAMLSDSALIIMDEPFTGLDDENRKKTAAYILEKLQGRTLLVTTHREEDIALLEGKRIKLQDCSVK